VGIVSEFDLNITVADRDGLVEVRVPINSNGLAMFIRERPGQAGVGVQVVPGNAGPIRYAIQRAVSGVGKHARPTGKARKWGSLNSVGPKLTGMTAELNAPVMTQRIDYSHAAVGVIDHLCLVNAASVFAQRGAALSIVCPGGVAHTGFINDAGQTRRGTGDLVEVLAN